MIILRMNHHCLHTCEQLSIVVGVILHETLPSVVEEIGEGGVAVGGEGDLVVLCPHDDPNQGDVDVQGGVEGVHHVGDVLANPG